MTIAIDPKSGMAVYLTEAGEWEPAKTAINPQTKEMQVFDGKTWQPTKIPTKGIGETVDDFVRSAASGATFGFADEIAAAGDTAFGTGAGKPTYAENLAAQQARDKQIPASTKVPGEITGAVGGAVAAAPFAGAAGLASGFSRAPAAVRYPTVGTLGGATFGAGEAAPGERMEGAGKGALMGAGTGAIVGPVAQGAGTAARHAVSPQANVAADLGRAIKRDATTPDAVLAAARDLEATRPGVATLADVGGENVQGLVERVAQTPGAGRTIVIPLILQVVARLRVGRSR